MSKRKRLNAIIAKKINPLINDVDPNVTITTMVTFPDWTKQIIEKKVNVNDLDNFEQMENEAIDMWKKQKNYS